MIPAGEPSMGERDVVIVSLGGEGGGYTILGRQRSDEAWEFKVDGYDATPELIGEEAVVRRGDWVPTLQDVLGQINRSWYRLFAREVHPAFQVALLSEVTRCMLQHTDEAGSLAPSLVEPYRRWQRICGIPGSDEDDS